MNEIKYLVDDFNKNVKDLKKKNKELQNKSVFPLGKIEQNELLANKIKRIVRTLKMFDNQLDENAIPERYIPTQKEHR